MKPKTTKTLYRVTLDWENDDEGDFCEHAWAKDADAAILEVAKSMANSQELTGKDRKEFIADTVSRASPYAAEQVLVMVKDSLNDLLTGPSGQPTARSREMHKIICYLLEMEGVA